MCSLTVAKKHIILHFYQGSISCKLCPSIAPFAQLLIRIFGFIEPQMSENLDLLLLNFFTRKSSKNFEEWGAIVERNFQEIDPRLILLLLSKNYN